MLRELAVQNLALIEDVRVELQPGFCAWSGETGAGKTLLLEALGLLLGDRGSVELIRTGADELRVTGTFELARPALRSELARLLETDLPDEPLILSRRLTRAGRSYAYLNDQPVAVATLRRLGNVLVDIHSQQESQSLLQPAYQLRLLDAFGDLEGLRRAYDELAGHVRSLQKRLATQDADRQQRQRELALLRFEREELDKATLQGGELENLVRERERLVHAQALQTFAQSACDQLYENEGSVVEVLGRLLREGESWIALDNELADASRRLESLRAETTDLADVFRQLAARWEANPARLEEVEERLRLLRRLEVKYGRKIDELIAYRGTLEDQEARLQQAEEEGSTLREELVAAYARLQEAGRELGKQRQKVGKKLAAAVQAELTDLGMPDARLEARFEPIALPEDPMAADVASGGLEHLELMLAANKGEPSWPLRKVASGGELSRTMLALKTVLAKHDEVGTLVFDEIDANVGGRLGDVLGEKLAALGQTHQVVCVTHLPQVASYARHQWTIRKVRRGQRTVTSIELLGEQERLDELASMLRGKSRSDSTRREAAAMLASAKRRW